MPTTSRRIRVIPASENGYGPGSGYLVQYRDPEIGAWFDIGDPVSAADAGRRAQEALLEAPGGS